MIEGAAVFKSTGWYVRATESLEAVKLHSRDGRGGFYVHAVRKYRNTELQHAEALPLRGTMWVKR